MRGRLPVSRGLGMPPVTLYPVEGYGDVAAVLAAGQRLGPGDALPAGAIFSRGPKSVCDPGLHSIHVCLFCREAAFIAVQIGARLYCGHWQSWCLSCFARVRFVFSESMRSIQLGRGGPPGGYKGESGWRAVTRVLRSSGLPGRWWWFQRSPFFRSCGSAAGRVAADLLNTLMPSDCRVCGAAMAKLSRVRVCEACIERVGSLRDAEQGVYCSRCGDAMGMESARFAAALGVSECTMCRLAPPLFDRAVSFASYDGEMRRLLHLLKFEGMRGVATHLLGDALAGAAQRLRSGPEGPGDFASGEGASGRSSQLPGGRSAAGSIVPGEAAADPLLVVPVPLFATREKKRGYNQAELLAEAMLASLRRREPEWRLRLCSGVLRRVKDTPVLYALNPRQRRTSLRGAFAVSDAEAVKGREVLLVDDIMTTGATARECARALKLAGATRVWVVTAARALPDEGRGAKQPDALPPVLPGVAIWDHFSTPAPQIEGRTGPSTSS